MAEGANNEQNTKKPERELPEALKRNIWQKGQSGNPNGRPKKKPVTELYEEILNDPKAMDSLKAAVVKALTKGNMAMVLQLKEMTDRVEGKVTQPIEADVNISTLAERMARAQERLKGE